MFCPAFLRRKTNLLDFSIKIGTYTSLSWFDQSLVISCLNIMSVQLILAAGKDQLTPESLECFFFFFFQVISLY